MELSSCVACRRNVVVCRQVMSWQVGGGVGNKEEA
jgi:hypothetical protein